MRVALKLFLETGFFGQPGEDRDGRERAFGEEPEQNPALCTRIDRLVDWAATPTFEHPFDFEMACDGSPDDVFHKPTLNGWLHCCLL